MSRKYILFFLISSLLISCASTNEIAENIQKLSQDLAQTAQSSYTGSGDYKIVNGRDVASTEISAKLAILLLITKGSKLSTCTGVLVNKRAILTAAHCVSGASPYKVRIVFQTTPAEGLKKTGDYFAKRIIIHDKFSNQPQDFSDLAMIILGDDAPASYKPISLYEKGEPIAGDEVILMGYGITSENKKDSMVLRQTIKSYKNDINFKDGFFGIDQKSSTGGFCRGDSGAPVLVSVGQNKKLLGINSFTIGMEDVQECHTASVAMSVPHFKVWIKKHVAAL